jgi:hypothetical protein
VKLALRDACLMALADRNISDNEKLKLIGIADRVGMSEKQVNDLIDWVVKGYHWMQEGYDLLAIDV